MPGGTGTGRPLSLPPILDTLQVMAVVAPGGGWRSGGQADVAAPPRLSWLGWRNKKNCTCGKYFLCILKIIIIKFDKEAP